MPTLCRVITRPFIEQAQSLLTSDSGPIDSISTAISLLMTSDANSIESGEILQDFPLSSAQGNCPSTQRLGVSTDQTVSGSSPIRESLPYDKATSPVDIVDLNSDTNFTYSSR